MFDEVLPGQISFKCFEDGVELVNGIGNTTNRSRVSLVENVVGNGSLGAYL